MKISVEQRQDYLYTFTIQLLLEDSSGGRIVSIPVSEKWTTLNVKAEKDVKVTPDPAVKLLFRSVEK